MNCPKCNTKELVIKSGFQKSEQRYYCKPGDLYFTSLTHQKKHSLIATKQKTLELYFSGLDFV